MLTLLYEDMNDAGPWGRRLAAPEERIEDRLEAYLSLSETHVVKLAPNDHNKWVQHVSIIPEGSLGWDGASWMHASCHVQFDNDGDTSCAVHNLIASAIYSQRDRLALLLGVDDVPYLDYKDLRQVKEPTPFLEVNLPWVHDGSTATVSWPISRNTLLADIGRVADALEAMFQTVHLSTVRILADVAVIKVPLKTLAQTPRSVFISHSSGDKESARRLAEALRNGGCDPWLDEDRILVGQNFVEELEAALSTVDFVVVMLSPRFLKGPWAKREYQAALERESREGHVVILPALLDACNIPPMLRSKHHADLTSSFDEGVQRLLHAMRTLSRRVVSDE